MAIERIEKVASGNSEILKKFDQMPDKIQVKILKPILDDLSERLLLELRSRAPVDTGELSRSIESPKARKSKGAVVDIVGGKFYGRFLEFGTKYMTARPWVAPVMDGKGQQILDEFVDRIGKAIEGMD